MADQQHIVYVLAATTLALLIATIVLAVQKGDLKKEIEAAGGEVSEVEKTSSANAAIESNVPANTLKYGGNVTTIFDEGENTCAGMNPNFPNVDCIHVPGPQAGANVTKGYKGEMEVGDLAPNLNPYWASSMCAVNVHWHLGTEHYSVGEYDENGDGPAGNIALNDHSEDPEMYHSGYNETGEHMGEVETEIYNITDASVNATETGKRDLRNLAASEDVRGGFRCHHYDADDEKFTKPYEWKHCKNMVVGETYEVHWPHSAAGACGTINQFQTPFYDGVFCNLPVETFMEVAKDPQNIANAVGVQAQIYTIVNDESYFYPDMMRGWIVDEVDEMAQDIAYYTGSTTGTSRSNQICSAYTPITWQVDRKCHMISASSFDKLCYDMKQQRDDMTYDLHAHGSRELVKNDMVANNQADRKLEHEGKNEDGLTAAQERHLRVNGHYHDHDHDHEWY